MEIIQLYTGSPLRNFSYLIVDSKTKKAICVDPYYPEQILQFLKKENLQLYSIFNTHEHRDHTIGNEGLANYASHGVLCHPNALGKIPESTEGLEEGKKIPWGKGEIEILHTPGHTFSHICLLLKWNNKPEAILTGDTLFNAGVGNCKNGGNPNVLYQTIKEKFSFLPDSIKVYPGHDYWENNLRFTLSLEPQNQKAFQLLEEYKKELKKGKFLVSTLGLEKEISLFFRLPYWMGWKNFPEPRNPKDEEEIFLLLRKLRDSW